MDKLPGNTDELLDLLDQLIPNKCPDLEWTDRKVWFEAGRRSVVDMLLAKRKTPSRRRVPTEDEPMDDED